MPGHGTKYVTFEGDKTVHLLAAGERTECGLPITIPGAAWTYEGRDLDVSEVCSACERQVKLAAKVVDEQALPIKGKARSGIKA